MTEAGQPLLVIAAHSNSGVAIEDTDGSPTNLQVIHFRRRTGRPLPGDRVLVDEAMAITEILPRRNRFGRGIWGGRFREIAANLDQVFILVAPEPAPSRDLIHRYLAAACILGIEPRIILNKSDLDTGALDPTLARFEALGHPVTRVSAEAGTGVDEVAGLAGQGITLIAGQSGVGKTSLANRLIPDLDAQTTVLSRVTGKGTHTTTTCRLHRLPAGGWLADSPGVWEYSLWQMEPRALEQGFAEFRDFSGHCRFRDCRHLHEPGCAVRAAVARGELTEFRYQAWRRLLAEVQGQSER